MAIRMTGLASNMDTESIIKQLMSAKSMKKVSIEAQKTKLEWSKETWADLNTKLYKLYTDQASKLRLQSTYNAKQATSSDETLASVTAGSAATNGSYSLQISQIATSQYLTSGKLTDATADTTLSSLDSNLVGKEITITNGTKTSYFQVKSTSKISDFVSSLQSAGLNASYDAGQDRLFISGKNSGEANIFSMTTTSLPSDEIAARADIESYVGYYKLNDASKTIVNKLYKTMAALNPSDSNYAADKAAAIESLTDVAYTQRNTDVTNAATAVLSAQLYKEHYSENLAEQKATYYDKDGSGNFTTIKTTYQTRFKAAYAALTAEQKGSLTESQYVTQETDKLVASATDAATKSQAATLIKNDAATKVRLSVLEKSGVSDLSSFTSDEITKFGLLTYSGTDSYTRDDVKTGVTSLVNTYLGVSSHSSAAATNSLNALGLTEITSSTAKADYPTGMALVLAQDSKFTLNGAELTSEKANVTVNGLTINLKNQTAINSKVTFTVSTDITGVYNSIKDFATQYNTLVKEMNTLYYAESAKGYEPLTDEQKDAMSDTEVEKWETKIKGALLKNDSLLGGLLSSMRTSLSSGVEVDGKTYSLASFGVSTSNNYSEGGLLHIYGDTTDSTYGSYTDKLKKAIGENPDLVMSVFTQVGQKLYSTMANKMASSKVSSAMTFYNDKQMKKQIEEYSDEIDDWTDRLTDMEDAYYKQFSSMETAMSKLTSQQKSLSSLFG